MSAPPHYAKRDDLALKKCELEFLDELMKVEHLCILELLGFRRRHIGRTDVFGTRKDRISGRKKTLNVVFVCQRVCVCVYICRYIFTKQ